MAQTPGPRSEPTTRPSSTSSPTSSQQAEIAVLTEYRGLSVAELQDLRGRLRPLGVDYVVAKNTLARFAAERIGRASDRRRPGRSDRDRLRRRPRGHREALQDYARINRTFVLKAALLGDRRLTRSGSRAAGHAAVDRPAARVDLRHDREPAADARSACCSHRWPAWRACSRHDGNRLKNRRRRGRR